MSRNRVNQTDGSLTMVAGRGKAEYGASTVRTGTVTLTAPEPQATTTANITFSTPMPDADYLISFEVDTSIFSVIGTDAKTAQGFMVAIRNVSNMSSGSAGNPTLKYTAFKLYTDTEYNEVLEKVSKIGYVRDSITVDSTKNVASVIKANCIPVGILKSVNYPCLVTNRNTGNVCKVYLSQGTGDLLAGETITAGPYDISTFYPIA